MIGAPESAPMRLLRRFGRDRLAWSLRRLHCPVPRDALVLEVGSGGNPYARANVLLDAYEATRERHWVPLVADRPTVLGFVENLPFRDQAFDFVIASHVLEHSTEPARFLGELQRVARAGYIEVPDAFMERVNPYRDHRLEITVRDGRLLIRRKPGWRTDPTLVELYEPRAKRWIAGETIPNHPFDFHVRHYWRGRIDYEVLDDDVQFDPDESAGIAGGGTAPHEAGATGLRQHVLAGLRRLLSQGARNRALDLLPLLRCPACHHPDLQGCGPEILQCAGCGARYAVRDGMMLMHPMSPEGTPPTP
ncbi:MAG: methyltransferase domain-containing protein [bacterium]|jgi:SAM-dependent methyltransferase|nr:methyltransferase domain-containing protein [Betaproteobacteria bacterium]